jgi:hypothetical protein
MRHIYVDEAGTSASEPISVVAAIIVQPGSQLRAVQQEISRVLDVYVPSKFREGYVFHATELFSGPPRRSEWPGDTRWNLLAAMTSIPQRFLLPISYCMIRRHSFLQETYTLLATAARLTPHEVDHAFAFACCAAAVDKHLRKTSVPEETAVLFAENVDGMKKALSDAVAVLRLGTIHLPSELIRHDVSEIANETVEHGEEIKISRILGNPRFAKKQEDPLLQLADAAAFTLRRWATLGSRGEELMSALRSQLPVIEDFSGPSSWGTWSFGLIPAQSV